MHKTHATVRTKDHPLPLAAQTDEHLIFMRILFLSDNYPPEVNAPASRLSEHAKYWIKEGAAVNVVTTAPNFPEGVLFEGYKNAWYSREDMNGVDLVRVKTYITRNEGFVKRSLDYISFMFSGFFAGLFQQKPDVLVATSPQFFNAIGGWALAKVRRVPYVFEVRDLWPASIAALGAVKYPIILKWLEKLELFLYRNADAVITVTEAFKDDLMSRGIDGDKIHVVLNGVDLSHYKKFDEKDAELAKAHGLEGKFVAGYVGTHGMAHGLDKIIEAAELLRDQPDVRILLVGAGSEKEKIDNMIAERGLDNVVSLGRFPKEDMNRIWSLCDVALIHLRDLPVFSTVIPSKLFESMGVGIPVLMGLPEGEATGIVKASDCGELCEPENPASIAETLKRMYTDKARYQQMVDNCLAAAQVYSREALASKMAAILRSTAGLPALETAAEVPPETTAEPQPEVEKSA